jgi:hypothetical protein
LRQEQIPFAMKQEGASKQGLTIISPLRELPNDNSIFFPRHPQQSSIIRLSIIGLNNLGTQITSILHFMSTDWAADSHLLISHFHLTVADPTKPNYSRRMLFLD